MADIITVTQRFINNLVAIYQLTEAFGLDVSKPSFGYCVYGKFCFYPTNDVLKADFIVIDYSNNKCLIECSTKRIFEIPAGKTPSSFLKGYLNAKFLRMIKFSKPVNQNILEVAEALGAGFEFEILEDDYYYFLNALPPVHMGARYRSEYYSYGFKGGDDAITHFRKDPANGKYYAVRGDEYILEQRLSTPQNARAVS